MGQRVNRNVEWVTDEVGNVLGYQLSPGNVVSMTGGGGGGGSAPVDLVVFAGQSQSNSNGTTGNDVPAGLQGPMPNAMIWNPGTSEWVTYQAGVSSALHLVSGKYPNPVPYWGFEAEYLRRYRLMNPGRQIYVVKMGFSTTSLDQAARTANRGCWDPALRVELYDFLVRAINGARADLRAQGLQVNVRNMVWIQGETDGTVQASANAYQANLGNFLLALRRDADMQSVPITIARINSIAAWVYGATVRAAQVAVGDGTPNCRWFNCDDLPLAADNTHYNPAGVVEGGKRAFFAGMTATEAYQAYAAKLQFVPNAGQKAALLGLIQGLIERSLFASLEVLQLYCMPDQISALANLIPYDIAGTNSGMAFTPKQGFTGTSVNSFLNTGIGVANTSLMKQNDESLSVYIGNNTTTASGVDMGSFVANPGVTVLTVNPNASSNFRVNHVATGADNTFVPGADVSGLWSMQRDAAAASRVYQNGAQVKADAVNASGGAPTTPIFVGNRSLTANSGTAGTTGRLYQAFAAGSSRSPAQEAALYGLLQTFIANFTVA